MLGEEPRDPRPEGAQLKINFLLSRLPRLRTGADAEGCPCVESKVPQDFERDLAMPGGHIFHGDLAWPWASDYEELQTPSQRWGVATDRPGVLVCGSGARRGGAVSALGGHNAARAVLEAR